MEIKNFDYFKVGTVFNPIICRNPVKLQGQKISIDYPMRLNAMAIDPSKIVENNNMKYTPGEVVFSTQIFAEIEIGIISDEKIVVNEEIKDRETVIRHACLIMKKALGYEGGFQVNIKNYNNLKHCGLGSTGCLQAGTAAAINHLFGCPIEADILIRYLAQNYGEEIDHDSFNLNPVQCIGGSAASGLHTGGLLVLAGESTVILSVDIKEDYDVIIGIPDNYVFIDSKCQFDDEKENLDKFMDCGTKYKNEIAFNMLHYFLPSAINGNLEVVGDVIYDYRYNMGSIQNCSYTYNGMVSLMDELSFLKTEKYVDVLSISSVGPAVFAITKNSAKCLEAFKEKDMKIIKTKINNGIYKVNYMK
ncbi:putative sugar kinase [Lachnotalea glycerini]|jgi:predicted sugar kinase|uniref:Putative sugar kinase n=1 Tax=Lachnotalea glycerini TaxID=1763509 RepID=A0A318EXG5_9FIRM|nr:hypothetical protein [Lachnotalea glycerini]PXV95937.1 putative sugar kinase [Lachnotalea glycerini]